MPRPIRPEAAAITRSRRAGRRSEHRFRPGWSPPAETLEIRIVPSADVWTGGGSNNLFSNVNNWQGGAVPKSGDNLDFPATATSTTPHDDLLGVGFGTIAINASGYAIWADGPMATTGIRTTYSSGTSTLSVDLSPSGDQTTPVTVATGGTLELSGSIGGKSAASSLGVKPVLTSTLLGGWAASVVFGQQATFSAYVSPLAPSSGNPSGSVTFYDGTTSLGQATLVNGWATLTTSSLSGGGHAVTAVYTGNPTTAGSRSLAFSEVVTPDTGTTTLTSSAPQAVYGQPVALTDSISVNAPGTATRTGTVTLIDGSAVIGIGTMTNGKATFTTTTLSPGPHTICAVYGGSGTNYQSWSPAIGQNVIKANTGTGFISSAQVVAFEQTATYTASVVAVAPGAGTPTGVVRFYEGTSLLGLATLSGGSAMLTVPTGSVGSHPITVAYSGDADFNASVSTVLTETVTKANPRIAAFEQVVCNSVFFPTSVMTAYTSATVPTGT
ncbi:MAG TPA: Ig-like domain-containing protein, partial [Isosphaeraceae bacterium]